MMQITIPNTTYEAAERRAKAEGYASAESFITELLDREIAWHEDGAGGENMDHFFTPEILAEIDEAAAEARLGKNITLDEMWSKLRLRV